MLSCFVQHKQMAMESPEFKSLKENISELEIALRENFKPILEKLHASGLISNEDLKKVRKKTTRKLEKSQILIRSIENQVKLSPSQYYHELVMILSDKAVYKDIVLKLETSYSGMISDDATILSLLEMGHSPWAGWITVGGTH